MILFNWAAPEPKWRSLKSHGQQGEFGLELDPGATGQGAISEPRLGGISKISIDFGQPVTGLLTGVVEAENLTTGNRTPATSQRLTKKGYRLTLEFAGGLPDMACYRISLQPNLPLVGLDLDCIVRGLMGDVASTGTVEGTKSEDYFMNPEAADAGNFFLDITGDGIISEDDSGLMNGLIGNSASCLP